MYDYSGLQHKTTLACATCIIFADEIVCRRMDKTVQFLVPDSELMLELYGQILEPTRKRRAE